LEKDYQKARENYRHAMYLFNNLRADDDISLIDSVIVQLDQAERKLNEEVQNFLVTWMYADIDEVIDTAGNGRW